MRRTALRFALAVALATLVVLLIREPWQGQEQPGADAPRPTVTTTPTALGVATQAPATEAPVTQAPATQAPATTQPTAAPDRPVPDLIDGYPPPAAGVLRAMPTRLADGDSFELRWIDEPGPQVQRDEVRLLGINAPESGSCFGADAGRFLRDLFDEHTILVEIVETEDGGFGRQISNVWVDTEPALLVNVAMVEAGMAIALTGDGRYAELIATAQKRAISAEAGLWNECVTSAEVAIVDLVSDAPGRDDFNLNGEWVEVRNTGSIALDLEGWGLRDESTRHRFAFPANTVLAPGATLRIGSGCEWHEGADEVDLHWCADDPVWNNNGDTAWLSDPTGRFVDTWGYVG